MPNSSDDDFGIGHRLCKSATTQLTKRNHSLAKAPTTQTLERRPQLLAKAQIFEVKLLTRRNNVGYKNTKSNHQKKGRPQPSLNF